MSEESKVSDVVSATRVAGEVGQTTPAWVALGEVGTVELADGGVGVDSLVPKRIAARGLVPVGVVGEGGGVSPGIDGRLQFPFLVAIASHRAGGRLADVVGGG